MMSKKQRTLAIIKPDIITRSLIGEVLTIIERRGFRVVCGKFIRLSVYEAEEFYFIHKGKVFFPELVKMMSSSKIFVLVLEGDDVIYSYRNLMGATNPSEAEEGTIRGKYAISIGENSVHGSDSLENASREISFFFSENELVQIVE